MVILCYLVRAMHPNCASSKPTHLSFRCPHLGPACGQDDHVVGDLERKDLTAVVVKESARGSQMVGAGRREVRFPMTDPCMLY